MDAFESLEVVPNVDDGHGCVGNLSIVFVTRNTLLYLGNHILPDKHRTHAMEIIVFLWHPESVPSIQYLCALVLP
jgi:hypothetical protein